MKKKEMLQRIAEDWQRLTAVLYKLSDEEKQRAQMVGKWSVKDVMAHLSSWESVCLERLGKIRKGEGIEIIPDEVVDVWNARAVEKSHNQQLGHVQDDFERIHALLVRTIGELPDELWNRNAGGVVDWIADNTFQHYTEHLEKLLPALTRYGISSQTKAPE